MSEIQTPSKPSQNGAKPVIAEFPVKFEFTRDDSGEIVYDVWYSYNEARTKYTLEQQDKRAYVDPLMANFRGSLAVLFGQNPPLVRMEAPSTFRERLKAAYDYYNVPGSPRAQVPGSVINFVATWVGGAILREIDGPLPKSWIE